MTEHDENCAWHVDQYPWECTCGAIKRKEALDELFANDADLIDIETEQKGGWKEAGQPWLWTYDPHLKGTGRND